MNIALRLAVGAGFLAFVLTVFRDIAPGMIFNLDAFLIVVGGTGLAVFVGFPLKRVKDAVRDVSDAFNEPMDRNHLIRTIVDMARVFRRADILF